MTIQPAHVRTLVAAQLRLDVRHPKTGAVQSSRVVLTVLAYAFSSLVLAASMAERGASLEEVLFAGLSFAAVLAAFGVAGSYEDLMGRPREHANLLTLPIAPGTLYVARLVNIGLFVGMMGLSTALPVAVMAALRFDPWTGTAVGAVLMAMVLVVAGVVLAAIWTLTLAAPLRLLKPVLAVSRALLIGALVLGYQWVATQEALASDAPWWPARWVIAGLWEGSLVALLGLTVALWGLIALFGGPFARRYTRLLRRTADAEARHEAAGRTGPAPSRWERWSVRTPEARAAFGFAVAALRGDRLVRGRVWPAALLAFVFAAFAAWSGGLGDLLAFDGANILGEPSLQLHLSVLTVLLFAAQTLVLAVQATDTPEAAWSVDVLPIRSHRALQVGAQQALLWRVLAPLHLALFGLLALSMPVLHAALHAGFWFFGAALLTRSVSLLQRQAPFTRRSDRFSAGEKFVPLILAVPAAVLMMLGQSLTFTQPASAALMVLGMAVLHAGLGRLPSTRRSARPVQTVAEPMVEPVCR